MRLINEDTVMEIIERVTNEAVEKKQPKYLIQSRIIAEIAGLPTIEAEPVKHGRFKAYSEKEKYEIYKKYHEHFDGTCSECSSNMFESDKFCAECGARMDGDSE